MIEALLIFSISLIPSLVSLWLLRHTEVQTRNRLRTAMNTAAIRSLQSTRFPADHQYFDRQYFEGIGHHMGDITCQFNARSAYIRCAVNPLGPCQECPHYRSIEFPELSELSHLS
ncbi:MAG: DUF6464 family protein [Leptolyngbyaceae bacterium]|nr:DUF6464 family protein [Leptolyngbyaceae bacterium]